MKIELEINDLKTTIDGLNNAIIAYNDFVRKPIYFGCEENCLDPKWFGLIKEKNDFLNRTAKIDKRIEALKSLYNQLTALE